MEKILGKFGKTDDTLPLFFRMMHTLGKIKQAMKVRQGIRRTFGVIISGKFGESG